MYYPWENGSSASHRLMVNKESFVYSADQELACTMTPNGSDPLPTKQWFCFKFLCHSFSPQNQCDLRLPQPTEGSHETCFRTQKFTELKLLFLVEWEIVICAGTERQPMNLLFLRSKEKQRWIMWVYSTVIGKENVHGSMKYHPPPKPHPQGGLYSGLHFALCLCRREHATWLDGDAVQFPVKWKHLFSGMTHRNIYLDFFTDKASIILLAFIEISQTSMSGIYYYKTYVRQQEYLNFHDGKWKQHNHR